MKNGLSLCKRKILARTYTHYWILVQGLSGRSRIEIPAIGKISKSPQGSKKPKSRHYRLNRLWKPSHNRMMYNLVPQQLNKPLLNSDVKAPYTFAHQPKINYDWTINLRKATRD